MNKNVCCCNLRNLIKNYKKKIYIIHFIFFLLLTACGDIGSGSEVAPKVIAVASGFDNIAILMDDGSIEANMKDHLDDSDYIAVEVGYANVVGLKADGTVESSNWRDEVEEWTDIQSISVGYDNEGFIAGLKKDGTVITDAWRSEFESVKRWKDIVQIDVGNNFIIGLKKDGTVVAAGENDAGQLNVSSWKDVKQISAGGGYSAALTEKGKILITEIDKDKYEDRDKIIGTARKWKDIVSISAGGWLIAGLTKEGQVKIANASLEEKYDVDDWDEIVDICSGWNNLVALKKDGDLLLAGWDRSSTISVNRFNRK